MIIEGAIVGVALALPVWLLVEEVFHRAYQNMVESESHTPVSGARVPAPRAA
jgi:hypothetical protein